MNKEESPIIKNIIYSLLFTILILAILGGVYSFGKTLNEDIGHKKEMDKLAIEKLKLEIQLKKLQLLENKTTSINKTE